MLSSLSFLEIAANASAISLVAVAYLLLARTTGVLLLELTPIGLGIALTVFGIRSGDPVVSSDVRTLFFTSLGSAVLLAPLLYFYSTYRKAAGGESSLLIFSFAVLNAVIIFLGLATGGRSIPVEILSPKPGGFDREALEMTILICNSALLLLLSFLTRRPLMAAIQLARDDDRLLDSFGLDARRVRFGGVLGATLIICLGISSFVALQESFAVTLFEGVLIPAFAITLVQTKVAPVSVFGLALLFVGLEQTLTTWTGELLRRSNQGMLFSLFALASIRGWRLFATGAVRRRTVSIVSPRLPPVVLR